MLANDGVTVIDVPVWENGTATTADQHELLRFFDGVEPAAGFIAFGTSGGPEATIEELKAEHLTLGTLAALSALAPPYTVIEDFSALNTANYQLNYSGGLYTTVASPVSISPNSARHESTTAGTLISTNGSTTLPAYPAVGDTIKLDIYMSSTGATYQQIILYFGTGAANNQTYRMQLDYKNNVALYAVATGGSPSTLDSTTFSSRPLSTWLELSVDWKDTSGTTTTIDCIDKSTGLSILTAPLSSTNSAQDGNNGIGFYCKSASGSPIYLNTLRFTT